MGLFVRAPGVALIVLGLLCGVQVFWHGLPACGWAVVLIPLGILLTIAQQASGGRLWGDPHDQS